jgi:hypothetical protein
VSEQARAHVERHRHAFADVTYGARERDAPLDADGRSLHDQPLEDRELGPPRRGLTARHAEPARSERGVLEADLRDAQPDGSKLAAGLVELPLQHLFEQRVREAILQVLPALSQCRDPTAVAKSFERRPDEPSRSPVTA